jgi:hypothetical protein
MSDNTLPPPPEGVTKVFGYPPKLVADYAVEHGLQVAASRGEANLLLIGTVTSGATYRALKRPDVPVFVLNDYPSEHVRREGDPEAFYAEEDKVANVRDRSPKPVPVAGPDGEP